MEGARSLPDAIARVAVRDVPAADDEQACKPVLNSHLLPGGSGSRVSCTSGGRNRIVLLPSGLCWELGAGPVYAAWDDVTSVRA